MIIPVIDFSECGLQKPDDELSDDALGEAGNQLYAAFSSAGFAYLSRSGISRGLVDDVNDAVGEFFSLPLDEKMKFSSEKIVDLSYDPVGSLTMNPKRPFDYQEGLRIPLNDEHLTFPDIPHLKEKFRELKESCRFLLLRILHALGIAMKLKDPKLFVKSHRRLNKDDNYTNMKFIRYPPVTDDTEIQDGQLRIGEHSDFGSVTLLFQDEIGGLQIQTSEGEFVDAPHIPDTVLLNIEDMMEFWAGGRLKSTIHRVVFPSDPQKRALPRRSITFFSTLDNEVVLRELEFKGASPPAKSDRELITSGEYTRRRFDAAYY